MKNYPDLKERISTLVINCVLAYAVLVAVTGGWVPSGSLEAVWFVSALSFWFLTLLSAPWFLPPRDALINAVGVLLVLAAVDYSSVETFQRELDLIRWAFIGYSIVVILMATITLLWHDSSDQHVNSRFLFRLTGILGQGEILFTGPALLSIIGGYQQSFVAIAWLLVFWIFAVVVRPIEKLASIIRLYRSEAQAMQSCEVVGIIARIDHPNILRVKLNSNGVWPANRLFIASMPDGSQQFVISLFTQVQGTDVVGTGLCVGSPTIKTDAASGEVISSHDEEKTAEFLEKLSGSKAAKLVGFVVENSTIGIVAFEIAWAADLQEGDVVFVRLSDQDVFYQIIAAQTAEESFDANPRGTHIVKAAQLGTYSADDGFKKYNWLPAMNTPLFSAKSRVFPEPVIGEREFEIGKVPSTNVSALAGIDELIEYHTAILGITGTGKTEVALDIVRQAAEREAKVFCVDFTGDYRERLSDLDPIFPAPDSKKAANLEKLLAFVDAYGFKAGDEKKQMRELLDDVRAETKDAIEEFLQDAQKNIAIFELAEISNSKAGLRLTEIYLSAIMNWARENRRARQILICLEEAHTIVPESYQSGFDGETKWVVERIGQIALQGRKYGVGLMVITQRTALVSKTILSQCNTFLTHSLIDQTSLKFLESVYSSEHTKLIPNLGKFEFLAFGKAIKAERPIILKREFDPAIVAASEALNKKSADNTLGESEPTTALNLTPPNDAEEA